MNVSTFWWMICLLFIQTAKFSFDIQIPFVLEKEKLTAMEGSCVQIKCQKTNLKLLGIKEEKWFWIKEPVYVNGTFEGIIVFSEHNERAVSPQFKGRVKYITDPTTSGQERLYNILICDLNKTDSGNYSFRFEAQKDKKWITPTSAVLTVINNPCPITFEKPAAVMENQTIKLECSTLNSCPSKLKINQKDQIHSESVSESSNTERKTITYDIYADRKYDGNEFSCQTTNNTDFYLIKNVTLTVEYAPREVKAVKSQETVKEGDSLTLTCSAKGKPHVTFTWYKNKKLPRSGAEMNIPSVKESDDGFYHCEAENKHGTNPSNTLNLTVLYPPDVFITEPITEIKEGDAVSLQCSVKRSRPAPSFVWFKDGKQMRNEPTYEFKNIRPENSGNYSCTANNSVGAATSNSIHLKVQYKPRSSVSMHGGHTNNEVSTNSDITFVCDTSAEPQPCCFSWFRYKQSDPSQRTAVSSASTFTINPVQREHEACYTCNATNVIGEGETSQPTCIRVRFPPTNLNLSMDTNVKEGQKVSISCSAESFPTSEFKLQKSNTQHSGWIDVPTQPAGDRNTLSHSFTATPDHAGAYVCIARNSENETKSQEKNLIVNYDPKNVTIKPLSDIQVKENDSFSLSCTARSHPASNLFTWIKDGKNPTNGTTGIYRVASAKPSDGGKYICRAENEVGTGNSNEVEIKVKYAPKRTTILRVEESLRPDGRRIVRLRCSSESFPAATYVWYTTAKVQVSEEPVLTVTLDDPEEYYCVGKNQMGQKSSDLFTLAGRGAVKTVILILICVFLLFIVILVFARRNKRKRLVQQRAANSWPFTGFLTRSTEGRRGSPTDEMSLRGEEFLTEQTCSRTVRPNHLGPDLPITSIYCTVNPFYGQQTPSVNQQSGNLEEDSLNYASLHFPKKQKKPEDEVVYSEILKKKQPQEKTKGNYENIPGESVKSNTETSDNEEEDVCYTQVNIRGAERTKRKNSDSQKDTVYSQVKI